ncbi:MAG: c-type cytochrome, partial [Bacteroidota bacterium]
MKTFLRILKRIGLILLVILVLFVAVVYIRADRTFEAPLPEISASRDSAVIARGEYLVYGPAHCADCHTSRDQRADVLAGKHVPLHGGGYFDLPFGRVYTHNLTSDATGLLSFSDYEIARSLRYGVAKDGHALLDFMPFHNLSDEDLTAVISFLRTLEPVKYEVPKTEFNFIGKAIKAFMIKPIGP